MVMLMIGVVLVAIIVGGVYALAIQTRSGLPASLDICVGGAGTAYHAHAHLTITINGSPQPIPPDLGRNGGCLRPLHTHSSDNVIHIEPDQEHAFTITDLFLIWGGHIFNSTYFISHTYHPGQLTMTLNGTPYTSGAVWDYTFPRNAQYNTETCSAGSCQQVDIVITLNAP
jgi:hypothetical protein